MKPADLRDTLASLNVRDIQQAQVPYTPVGRQMERRAQNKKRAWTRLAQAVIATAVVDGWEWGLSPDTWIDDEWIEALCAFVEWDYEKIRKAAERRYL